MRTQPARQYACLVPQGRQYAQDSVPQINMQQFNRLCADAGFVEPEGRLSPTAVEVVFIRYRPVGSRRCLQRLAPTYQPTPRTHKHSLASGPDAQSLLLLSAPLRLLYKEFIEALAAVAYEAGMQFEDVMVVLGCRSGQPLTPPASVRGSEGGGGGAELGGEEGSSMHLASIQEAPAQQRARPMSAPQPAAVGGAGGSVSVAAAIVKKAAAKKKVRSGRSIQWSDLTMRRGFLHLSRAAEPLTPSPTKVAAAPHSFAEGPQGARGRVRRCRQPAV